MPQSPFSFKLVSADSHIAEPPDLWTARMDAQYRDRAPRVIHEENGSIFVCEGALLHREGIGLLATKRKYTDPDFRNYTLTGHWRDIPEGAYDPAERLRELDAEGIEAELLYTSFGLIMYSIPDPEFQLAAFRAFNDWLADFCKTSPKRLFGVAMIPPGDPRRATAELVRCAGMGMRGAMISVTTKSGHGYDHPDYEPLWVAAEDLGIPVSLHVAAGTQTYNQSGNKLADFSLAFTPTMYTIAGMIFSGLFDRHPRLKVISVENDAAWPLAMLERMDDRFDRDQGWASRFNGVTSGRLPSQIFREHIACTFMRDRTAIINRSLIGINNIMWGSDYPHFDGGWPDAAAALAAQFEGVSAADQLKIGRTNAVEFYDLSLQD
jgi:predicted TIM-barrel fold metal-dependent hydrolase